MFKQGSQEFKQEKLAEMQEIAKAKGGQCLSSEYVNTKSKLRWQCAVGHEWMAAPGNIKTNGSWCPTCAGVTRGSIDEMRELAASKGGKCLSDAYVGNKSKLRWQCAKGHTWTAVPTSIKRGVWCPMCAGVARRSIDDMHELATAKGGKCLSDKYRGNKSKLRWQCSEGHVWEAIPNSIQQGQWCRDCAGKTPGTIEEMRELAESRGGKCLSVAYVNKETKLRWQCAEGHEWESSPGNINHLKSWCPICSQGNSERICRDVFRQVFGAEFKKIKPIWLINDRGNRMELDGFCEEFSLAFEYHGKQHYEHVGSFHRGKNDLARRKSDDEIKRALCKKNGVFLIEVPYTVEMDELPFFIIKAVTSSGKAFAMRDPEQVDVAAYVLPERLREMQELASAKGGKCLSTAYVNKETKLRWRCSQGHEWEATPGNIKNSGTWCLTCANANQGNSLRKSIEDMHDLATAKGGADSNLKCNTLG